MRNMQQLIPGRTSVKVTSAFRGYNHNEIIADGEMYDMQNMSGDKYPLLSLRKKRGISSWDTAGSTPVPLTGIHGRDQLVHIRGGQVYYNFDPVDGLNSLSTDESMLPKRIISMGAYVLIWPDKVYFNTANQSDHGSMERIFPGTGSQLTGADVSVSMCRVDGTDYDMSAMTIDSEPPEVPANGDYWIDQSGPNDIMKQWSSATEEWVEVGTTYVKISCTGIGDGLKQYDAITISGLEADSEDPRIVAEVEELNGTKIIYAVGDDYIVVVGLLNSSQAALEDQAFHADMKIPDLDFVCESNNRLWGCYYGLDGDGNFVNEIRASKLGDFKNWNCFIGLSTDSYAASVGTDGEWTGAITQRGYPVFFKENCIHRVSGSQPSNYSIQTTVARGVQRGSDRSLAVVAENIYYKARDAVMIYDGNMPEPVSEQMGEILYSDARAGVLHEKYYISMVDGAGNWRLFVFDTKHGNWYKEDSVQALGFGTVDDELFYIDEERNTMVSVTGSVGTAEGDFDWAAEFDLFGTTYTGYYDDPKRVRNAKYLSLFKVRMFLAPGAYMRLWIKYDDGMYEFIGERRGHDTRTFILPVIPKRCDHVRFKITGRGDAKVYDISRVLEVGGDGI